ncbi:MmcQ/YjbR family DNA-binding protein [Patulibacter minatonensis]|uniref:MmcQ/YjbR family DNA-binding protein n=1 Tax=Patulibacter minatonensis TaxID=298163 RepID=UPI00047E6D7E|nr:MmcQ/YjbR family DNA-binding protein [Patulibacter minatonensis]
MSTEADVRELALALPETVEKPSYGTPGFRVKDRLFARMWDGEDDVLVVWTGGPEEQEGLVAADPGRFFTTPHYDGHPHVLVRLGAVDREELAGLLEDSWLLRAPKRMREAFEADAG